MVASGVTPHRFTALDSLRGIAALGVAAGHLNAQTPIFGASLFKAGSLFVYFFFVLSGFVIAANYAARLRQGFPAWQFLWLRVGRIYPVHLAALACYVAIEIVALVVGPELTGRTGFAPPRTPEGLMVTALLLQSVYPPAIHSWLGQSWSVSVEMVLYGVAALAGPRLGKWWWVAGIAAAALAAWLTNGPLAEAGISGLLVGFIGFGLGGAAYAAWTKAAPYAARVPPALATAAEAALLGAAGWIMSVVGHGYFDRNFQIDLLFAVIVVVFAAQRGALSRLLSMRAPVLAGTVSYSLYMVHTLVESTAMTLLAHGAALSGHAQWFVAVAGNNRPAPSPALGFIGDAISAAVLLLCVGAAWLMWRSVEDPARRWSRDRSFLGRPPALSPAP